MNYADINFHDIIIEERHCILRVLAYGYLAKRHSLPFSSSSINPSFILDEILVTKLLQEKKFDIFMEECPRIVFMIHWAKNNIIERLKGIIYCPKKIEDFSHSYVMFSQLIYLQTKCLNKHIEVRRSASGCESCRKCTAIINHNRTIEQKVSSYLNEFSFSNAFQLFRKGYRDYFLFVKIP